MKELPTFLRIPGPPAPFDAITPSARRTTPMPRLLMSHLEKYERWDRFCDAVALLLIGAFAGALIVTVLFHAYAP